MKKLLVMLSLSLVLLPQAAKAATPEDRGLAIAAEANKRQDGFGDFTADMIMVLKNRHGQKSERVMRTKSFEVDGDGDKTLSIFDTPRDVKGTAFLTFSHKVGDDDQWLYLPALKRVKRISSRNKSGSFMGSEFSYEDVSSQEVEKYTYRWIRDETHDGQECYVIEFYPVDARNSGYTKQVKWIDKAEYRTLKVEYYDRKESLLKTLILSGYSEYSDRFWKASEMNMVNHQNGKSTLLTFTNYRFGTGLSERDFNQNSLKRVR